MVPCIHDFSSLWIFCRSQCASSLRGARDGGKPESRNIPRIGFRRSRPSWQFAEPLGAQLLCLDGGVSLTRHSRLMIKKKAFRGLTDQAACAMKELLDLQYVTEDLAARIKYDEHCFEERNKRKESLPPITNKPLRERLRSDPAPRRTNLF